MWSKTLPARFPVVHSPVPGGKRFAFHTVCIVTLRTRLFKCFLQGEQLKVCVAINKEYGRIIIRTLADGIDPTTGEVLPKESVYNSPEVIRALYTLLEIANSEPAKEPLRNAGKPWTDAEDDKLRDEFLSKIKVSDIANEHGRTYGAIESRLEHLGLKKKPFWQFRKKNT